MRKELKVTISDEGRDKGKVFLIKEMPALQVERWATRALLALARSGVEIPDDINTNGLAGIAQLGVQALGHLSSADAEDLLGEMLTCIEIVPDPGRPNVTRPLVAASLDGDDIEEVKTLLQLRAEVFMLHTGFSLAGTISQRDSTPAPKKRAAGA